MSDPLQPNPYRAPAFGPADNQRIVKVETDQAFVLARLLGTPEEVKALSAKAFPPSGPFPWFGHSLS